MDKETEKLYRNNRKVYLTTDEIYHEIYRLERVLIRKREDRVSILVAILREMIRKDGRNFDTIVYMMLDMLHLELDAEMEAWKEKVKNFERGEIPEKDNLPF